MDPPGGVAKEVQLVICRRGNRSGLHEEAICHPRARRDGPIPPLMPRAQHSRLLARRPLRSYWRRGTYRPARIPTGSLHPPAPATQVVEAKRSQDRGDDIWRHRSPRKVTIISTTRSRSSRDTFHRTLPRTRPAANTAT